MPMFTELFPGVHLSDLLIEIVMAIVFGSLINAVFLRLAVKIALPTKIAFWRAYVVTSTATTISAAIGIFIEWLCWNAPDGVGLLIATIAILVVNIGLLGTMIKMPDGTSSIGYHHGFLLILTLLGMFMLVMVIFVGLIYLAQLTA